MGEGGYGQQPCPVCRRMISAAGFARFQHMKAHERRGLVEERRKRIRREVDGEVRTRTRLSWVLTAKGAARCAWDAEAGAEVYF